MLIMAIIRTWSPSVMLVSRDRYLVTVNGQLTSMLSETITMKALNLNNGLYLDIPRATSLFFTRYKKYMFKSASMIKYIAFSMRSQILLISIYSWLVCKRAGIQMQ